MPYPLHGLVSPHSLPNLTSECDPSSVTVQRLSAPVPRLERLSSSMDGSSAGHHTKQTGMLRFGFGKVFAGIKKLLAPSRTDTKRLSKPQPLRHSGGAGYVMPRENKVVPAPARNQLKKKPNEVRGRGVTKAKSSVRSRQLHSSSSALARISQNLSQQGSLPDLLGSSPSTNGRKTVYRVHSFSTGDDAALLNADDRGNSVRFSHPAVNDVIPPRTPTPTWGARSTLFVTNPDDGASIRSVATTASAPPDDIALSGDGLGDIHPIRPTAIWRDSNNVAPESYEAFKARFDGHPLRKSDSAPQLHFIPRLAPLNFDEEMEDIQLNRDEALRLLEGGSVAIISALPALPRDHPAVLKPQVYPPPLLPGPRLRDHEGVERVRPMTFHETQTYTEYEYFSADSLDHVQGEMKYTRFSNAPIPVLTVEKEEHPIDRPFSFPSTFKIVKKGKGKAGGVTPINRPRPRTPASFAANIQHKNHYDRVESGLMPVERPSNPVLPSEFSFSSGDSIGRTFLDSPTPPSSQTSSLAIPRKSVPSAPAPAPAPTGGTVPARHKMNDNGYPQADLKEAGASYSATPTYKPRTVDRVEAKAKAGIEKAAAKAEKKEATAAEKAAKKTEKERKKNAQRLDPVQKNKLIEGALRRLLVV